MEMLRHWFKGRKTDHIVWDGDKTKTICGLVTKPDNDIRFLVSPEEFCSQYLH